MNKIINCFELKEYSLRKQIQEEPTYDLNDYFIKKLNKENDKMKIKFCDESMSIDKTKQNK